MTLAGWVDTLAALPPATAWALLFGGAFVEYVFPPFPGDTVVVAGAVLVGAAGWSAGPAFAAVTAGAVVGGAVATAAGRWVARSGRLDALSDARRADVDRIVHAFRRHGAVYLVINRFVPGIRALFFVAAGIAGLRWRAVLGWSALSAVAWNALLFGAGWSVGRNVEQLEAWVRTYTTSALAVMAVALAVWAARRLRGRNQFQ